MNQTIGIIAGALCGIGLLCLIIGGIISACDAVDRLSSERDDDEEPRP